MLGYVLRRIAMAVLIVFAAVSVNFAMPRLLPGDAVEQQFAQASAMGAQVGDIKAAVAAMRAQLGLDRPVWRQYLGYIGATLRGDLGVSIARYPERVSDVILGGLPWTIGLLGVATAISFCLGTLLGAGLAWPGARALLAFVGLQLVLVSAVPYFILGLVLLALFGLTWKIFPVAGGLSIESTPALDLPTIGQIAYHAVLPGASIVLASLGSWAVTMRGMLVGVLGEDFIMLAEAKGLPPRRIFFAYALRNALLPQLTQLALRVGTLVSGAILVEVIFAYPGLGYRLYVAIGEKDLFVIQGIVLLLTLSIALSMLVLDLVYPLIDPRVSLGRR
jgi:peptide/nickel transport system permease protein